MDIILVGDSLCIGESEGRSQNSFNYMQFWWGGGEWPNNSFSHSPLELATPTWGNPGSSTSLGAPQREILNPSLLHFFNLEKVGHTPKKLSTLGILLSSIHYENSYSHSLFQWRIYIVKLWPRAPSRSNFLHFHAVFGEIWPNNSLAPPLWRNPGSVPVFFQYVIFIRSSALAD